MNKKNMNVDLKVSIKIAVFGDLLELTVDTD